MFLLKMEHTFAQVIGSAAAESKPKQQIISVNGKLPITLCLHIGWHYLNCQRRMMLE